MHHCFHGLIQRTAQYLLFFILIVVATITCRAQPARHVILISIDGLRPEFYLNGHWPAPNLRALMKSGIYARQMKSVFPSFTYPAHVAMMTGSMPARSGIYYNAPFEPLGASGKWNWDVSAIKVPTIWQALRSAGLSSGAVQWPVSVGAEIDYNIPEIWSAADPGDRISESRKYATKGLVEEVEQNATGILTAQNMNEQYLCLDDNVARIAAYIFAKYKPSLLALHFAGVDGAQHEYGTNSEHVTLAIAAVDRAFGHILETVRRSGAFDSTAILIVGDHGFSDINVALKPNVWLAQIGLMGKGDKWGAKFQPAGGSAFLYLQDPDDRKTLPLVQKAIRELPAATRKRFNLIDRNALDGMGVDSSAKLALCAVSGVVFSGSSHGADSATTKGGHHGYDPGMSQMMTGFIASGAGLRKGEQISELQVCDVATIIAALLGIEFKVPDGMLRKGILLNDIKEK